MSKRAIFSGGWRPRGGSKNGAATGPGTPPSQGSSARKPKSPRRKARRRPAKPRPDPLPVQDLLDPAEPGRRVVLPFPPAELSPNWRGHWSAKSPVAKAYRRLCWALALGAPLFRRFARGDGAQGPIPIRLDFFPPDRARRDDDNVVASFKAGRDGVADALKVDDSRFATTTVLHEEPRSCVVFTLLDKAPDGAAQGQGS